MDVFGVVEGSQDFELELAEGVAAEHGTQFQHFVPGFRLVNHQLLLVEEVDEVAEGVEACASDDHDDLARFGVGQLQSLSLGLADDYFFNGSFDHFCCEFPSRVGLEHYRDKAFIGL